MQTNDEGEQFYIATDGTVKFNNCIIICILDYETDKTDDSSEEEDNLSFVD